MGFLCLCRRFDSFFLWLFSSLHLLNSVAAVRWLNRKQYLELTKTENGNNRSKNNSFCLFLVCVCVCVYRAFNFLHHIVIYDKTMRVTHIVYAHCISIFRRNSILGLVNESTFDNLLFSFNLIWKWNVFFFVQHQPFMLVIVTCLVVKKILKI